MDKLVKPAIILTLLLVGAGVFYHYVIYLPKIEQIKQNQIAEDRRAEQKRISEIKEEEIAQKRQRKLSYDACLVRAAVAYDANWKSECRADFEFKCQIMAKNLEKNLRILARMENKEYIDNGETLKMCQTDNADWSNCKIPLERSDRLDETYKNDKETCFKEAQIDS